MASCIDYIYLVTIVAVYYQSEDLSTKLFDVSCKSAKESILGDSEVKMRLQRIEDK